MARAILLTLILLASAATHASPLTVLDFPFFDAGGKEYRSVSFQKALHESYGVEGGSYILLVYAQSLEDRSLSDQASLLSYHGAMEKLQLLYVVACPSAEDQDGYYVPSSKAKELSTNPRQFSVALIGEGGHVIKRWHRPISLKEIREALPITSNPPLQRDVPQAARP